MDIEIVTKDFDMEIFGFSGRAVNKDYAGTAFQLSGKMWESVKSNGLKNAGMNIWVYEAADMVFAGVQLNETPTNNIGLEHKKIHLNKYAYYKHIGPYKNIKQAGLEMREEIKRRGFIIILPYIEIYGHWKADETKSETELLMSLQ
jgi:effector-binding domain-containing protein